MLDAERFSNWSDFLDYALNRPPLDTLPVLEALARCESAWKTKSDQFPVDNSLETVRIATK